MSPCIAAGPGLAAVFALIQREARYQHVLRAADVPDTRARRAYAARLTSLGLRTLARKIQARPSRRGAELLP